MRARKDIIRALLCSATAGHDPDCTSCPYVLPQEFGGHTWDGCDCDQMARDAAEMLEVDARIITALIDDRKYYMEKYEELKNQVPQYDYVLPEEGAEDDKA